jgi:hypothetical protein
MQITQVATTSDGAQVNAARTWLIDTAVGELPQQIFRQVLYLRFSLDGVADGLQIVPAATHCRGRFDSYSYNAKTTTNPALVVVTKTVAQAVFVALAAPRQLTAVQLVNSFIPGASSKVTVHRVDGEQVVEDPTAEATFGAPFDIFIAEGIAVRNGAFAPTRVSAAISGIGNKAGFVRTIARVNTAALATDFTDARFALRLKNSSTTLTPALLAGVMMRSYPSAPRLGVAAATALLTPTFFLRLEGEIGKDGDANVGQFDAGAALATALQSEVDRFFTQLFADATAGSKPVLPTEMTVALVLESDAPCQLVIDEFAIGYQLVRRAFPDRAEKLVLRFAGDAVVTEQVTFHLPTTAVVTAATLTVAAKLGNRAFVDPAGNGLPPDSLAQATGVHLGLAQWAAQPLTPVQAVTTNGVVIGLLTLASNTQLTLALYEDWQGQPGKQLTTTTVDLRQGGQRLWQTVRFAEATPLFAQPYWLLLKALRGAAIWLAQAGTLPLQMVTQEKQCWQTVDVIANMQGLVHLLSPAVADTQAAPLALSIDGVPITTPPVTVGDRQRHDFTAALNTALAAGATTSALARTLAFATGQAGLLTVYPPEILYEG